VVNDHDLNTTDKATYDDGIKPWLCGVGPLDAEIMVVADCPKVIEGTKRTGFTSPAHAKLKACITRAGGDVSKIYFTYVTKYPMYSDRKPKVKDAALCRELFYYEVRRIKPKLIIPLGKIAVHQTLGAGYKMGEVVGGLMNSKVLKEGSPPDPVYVRTTREGKDIFKTPEDLRPAKKIYALQAPGYILMNPQFEAQYTQDIAKGLAIAAGEVFDEKPHTDCTVIDNNEKLKEFFNLLANLQPDWLCIDIESGGGIRSHDPHAYMRTAQIGISKEKAYLFKCYPCDEKNTGFVDPETDYSLCGCCSPWKLMELLQMYLRVFKTPIVGQNGRFDGLWFMRYGCDIRHYYKYDTMLAEHLIDSSLTFNLTDLTIRHTNLGKYDNALCNWKASNPSLVAKDGSNGYGCIPDEILFPYAAADVIAPRIIMESQEEKLEIHTRPRGHNQEYPSLWEATLNASIDLYEPEMVGLHIDKERHDKLAKQFWKKKDELTTLLRTAVANRGGPEDYNPASVLQTQALMFGDEDWSLKLMPLTSTGQGKEAKPWDWVLRQAPHIQKHYKPSTNKRTCETLSVDSPLVDLLLQYKRISKACSSMVRLDWEETGKGIMAQTYRGIAHSSFGQLTNTHRFKSRNPNLQNFAKGAERYFPRIFGEDNVPESLRSIVKPPDGWVMIECDWSQAELFTIAYLGEDAVMISALTTPGKDLHTETAVNSFKLIRLNEDETLWDETEMLKLAKDDPKAFKKLKKTFKYKTMTGVIIGQEKMEKQFRGSAKAINFG